MLAPNRDSPAVPSPLRSSMRVVTVAWLMGSVWMTAAAGAPLTE